MPEFRVRLDKKYLQRYAEGYLNDGLVATRGDELHADACERKIPVTHQQLATLERLVIDDGLSLIIAEDGTIRVD